MESTPANSLAANPLVIFNGGAEIEVTFNDGRREIVKIRQLPLRLMAEYGRAHGEEDKLIALFADRDAGWVESLTQESQEAVIEIGEQLNADPFFRWTRRRLEAARRLEPLNALVSASAKSASPSAPAAAIPPGKSKI